MLCIDMPTVVSPTETYRICPTTNCLSDPISFRHKYGLPIVYVEIRSDHFVHDRFCLSGIRTTMDVKTYQEVR